MVRWHSGCIRSWWTPGMSRGLPWASSSRGFVCSLANVSSEKADPLEGAATVAWACPWRTYVWPMRVAIVGGHGQVALRLHPVLVDAGHESGTAMGILLAWFCLLAGKRF